MRPAYLLVVRRVPDFVVYVLDYAYEVMPTLPTVAAPTPNGDGLCPHARSAVPPNVPCALLWTPMDCGGFGVPLIYTRRCLCHIWATDSRSVLVRKIVRVCFGRTAHGPRYTDRSRNTLNTPGARCA